VRQARHARIRLLLSYEDGAARSAQPLASAETPAFEPLLRSAVVNYEAATSWRAAPQPVDLARGVAAWVPPVPGWRLAVDRDGIYELTYPALASAGVAVDLLDPRTFQVFTGGEEVAIRVVGEEDGTFDAQDVILFWGEGPDDKYTNRNVYWLGYGQAMGLRMATRPAGTTAGVPVPPATWARPHFEENVGYWSLMPGDDALERFYWAYASAGESMLQTFSLEAVASVPGNATLLAGLVGYTSSAAVAPDHHVEVYVNGNLVGGAAWDSVSYHTAALPFPQDYLRSGDNEIRFRVPGDTGAPSELNLLDWFEVHYQREYQASDDMLRFGGDDPGTWAYHVANFSVAEVELFDITETERPEIFLGTSVSPAGSRYTLAFGDSSDAPRQYWAQSTARRLSPLSVVFDTPSDLHDPGNGADYLVIAHHDFLAALSPLLDARAAQGYRVVAVDVQDVYDEFAGGRLSPEAIRSFLAYAYHNWTPPAPSYVLLVGDAHFDPRDHMGYGLGIFVPTYLGVVDPWLGETATDNWYACIEGDDNLPDLHIGRVPANTAAEAAAAVAKIVAYESLEPAAWMSNAVFVTDNPDDAGDFYAYSDAVIAGYLPSTYTPSRLYLGSTCATGVACRSQLVAAINSGQLLVNYIGHGSVQSWAGESLFRVADVTALANGNRLPLFVPMTCLEGSYHYPFPDSTALGEAVVVTAGKGGVASWSPTGFGVSQGHDYLNKGLFEAFFDTGLRQLGPATYEAKLRLVASGSNLDQLDTYHILGDPALHINALDADVALTKTAEYEGTLAPGDLLTYTLAFANAGPGTADNVVLTDVLPIELVDPVVVYASPEVLAPRPGVALAWDIAPLLPG
ncbi:MAG: C25 family cysteine peptidase, partial [Anaerolineae bacterium]|nr:C25 family cysteine peptidase [Anaerolineae bacterium]